MRNLRALHIWLGAVGVCGLILFILACTPSWNADSSQVVFTYLDSGSKVYRLAIYDVSRGEIRNLFTPKDPGDDAEHIPTAQWRSNGATVLVFSKESDEQSGYVALYELSASTGEEIRKEKIQLHNGVIPVPVPEIDGSIYPQDNEQTFKVDLNEFSVTAHDCEDCENVMLVAAGNRLMYGRGKRHNAEEGIDALEVGFIDTETFKEFPYFEIPLGETATMAGILTISAAPDGTKFVMVEREEDHDRIVLCSERGIERTLPAKLPWNDYQFGQPEWSEDGEKLYVPVVREVSDGIFDWNVAEINLESGKSRTFSVVRGLKGGSDFPDSYLYYTRMALSPDGKTLAVSTGMLDEKALPKKERALVLIDLDSQDHRITRIPVPVGPPPEKKEK